MTWLISVSSNHTVTVFVCLNSRNEPVHDKTSKMQNLNSLAVLLKKVWVLSYPLNAQPRPKVTLLVLLCSVSNRFYLPEILT